MNALEHLAAAPLNCEPPAMLWKLWLYTNYDCNLKCSYCVAKSGPNVPRRALGIANIRRLVDELPELELASSVIKQVYAVTGRFDLIARIESPDVQSLGD